jgi:hypothetical protein
MRTQTNGSRDPHMKGSSYGCFLPDLTGFEEFHCSLLTTKYIIHHRSPPCKCLALYAVFFFELIDASSRIDKFLLSSKKWMAYRTNFYADVLFHRSRLKRIAAYTRHCRDVVRRMNCCLHGRFHSLVPWRIPRRLHCQNNVLHMLVYHAHSTMPILPLHILE